MIRVVHVISELEPGGAETQLLHLLRRIDRTRFEPSVVYLFGPGTLAGRFRKAGIPVRDLELRRWNVPLASYKLAAHLRRIAAPCITHLHLVHATVIGVPAAAVAGCAGAIVTRHFVRPRRRGLAHRLEPRLLKRADRVIAVSDAVTRRLTEVERLPASKIETIPHGIDLAWFDDRAAESRLAERWPAPTGAEIRIGAVGNWRELKGFDTLLAAFRRIRSRHSTAQLWIAGRRPGGGLPDAGSGVTLWYELQPEEVPAFLSQLDIYVQPSREESFGLAALEAMAAGLPVVATRTEGLAELVAPHETGLLIEVGDTAALDEALEALLKSREARESMGRAGRLRVERRYTIERTIADVQRVYESVLG
ncbi:MAG: glycosyltransferase [Candidatus Eisenbacteria bacterium]|nr:glycosyltransferase [Candidatus Eisenbacteria bacterium]